MAEQHGPLHLASGFAAADYDAWRRLVEKALAGADFDKRLVAHTADGLKIKPLYTNADTLPGSKDAPSAASSLTQSSAENGLGWQIHQRVVERDPTTANKVILEELEGGASGIVLQVASPGQHGLAIASAGDMARALKGMHLDLAPVQLSAGLAAPAIARTFLAAVAAMKGTPETPASRLNVDPIGALARFGTPGGPIAAALSDAIKIAVEARRCSLPLTAILVDATIPHEAGATEAQELAFLAAALVDYARAFEEAGVPIKDAFATISFALAVDTDLFVTAAKLRAARTIIARVAKACGAEAGASHVTAITSQRMMTKRDPWTNMLRTTVACAGAAFGGADAITVLPFTWPLGAPDRFARRVARNTQLVLQEESSLGCVADPVGGSWYVESLTDELARKAWSLFQEIEKAGGLVAALSSGAFQKAVAASAAVRAEAIAKGRMELTGVSVFPLLGEDGVTAEPYPASAPAPKDLLAEPLLPNRLAESFEALRDAADAYAAKHRKPPRVFLANLGDIIEHNQRSTWAWNFLSAGGIDGLNSDGYKDAAAAAQAFRSSGADIACLCSSDEMCAREGEAAAKALKAAGAKRVMMAGKPGNSEQALRAAGVDGFLFAGQNAITALQDLHKALGVS
jgi:methylmalonyl-CoA mutase